MVYGPSFTTPNKDMIFLNEEYLGIAHEEGFCIVAMQDFIAARQAFGSGALFRRDLDFDAREEAAYARWIGGVVKDVLGRVFKGSADSLVVHILNQSKPTPAELDQIRRAIDAYEKKEEP